MCVLIAFSKSPLYSLKTKYMVVISGTLTIIWKFDYFEFLDYDLNSVSTLFRKEVAC